MEFHSNSNIMEFRDRFIFIVHQGIELRVVARHPGVCTNWQYCPRVSALVGPLAVGGVLQWVHGVL